MVVFTVMKHLFLNDRGHWAVYHLLFGIVPIDNTMKLFQLVQKFYQSMGIYPPIQNNSINIRNLTFLFAMFLMFVSTAGEFLFKESSIIQQAQTFLVSITEIVSMVNVLTCIWKVGNILNLIEKLQVFIVKSKLLNGKFTRIK